MVTIKHYYITLDTLVIVRDQSSQLVYLNIMHKITKLLKFGSQSCEIIMEEKTPLSKQSCVLSNA